MGWGVTLEHQGELYSCVMEDGLLLILAFPLLWFPVAVLVSFITSFSFDPFPKLP